MTSGGQSKDNTDTLLVSSDFLTASVAPRKSARLSSALINYRRPDGLNLVPLGSSWALDVFARLHNGIRRELIDMYNMIDSMQRRIQELRTSDLKLFFDWWDLFSSYVEVSFDAYDKLLIPWIVKKDSLPDSLNENVRANMTQTVRSLLKNFDNYYSQMPRRPPDETMAKIIKGLVHMHPIVEYLEKFENEIPVTIESSYRPKDVRMMERKIAIFLHKTGDLGFKHMHLAVVARGMTDEVLSTWHKILPIWVRISYRSNSKLYSNTHLSVVRKLAAE